MSEYTVFEKKKNNMQKVANCHSNEIISIAKHDNPTTQTILESRCTQSSPALNYFRLRSHFTQIHVTIGKIWLSQHSFHKMEWENFTENCQNILQQLYFVFHGRDSKSTTRASDTIELFWV